LRNLGRRGRPPGSAHGEDAPPWTARGTRPGAPRTKGWSSVAVGEGCPCFSASQEVSRTPRAWRGPGISSRASGGRQGPGGPRSGIKRLGPPARDGQGPERDGRPRCPGTAPSTATSLALLGGPPDGPGPRAGGRARGFLAETWRNISLGGRPRNSWAEDPRPPNCRFIGRRPRSAPARPRDVFWVHGPRHVPGRQGPPASMNEASCPQPSSRSPFKPGPRRLGPGSSARRQVADPRGAWAGESPCRIRERGAEHGQGRNRSP